MVDKIKIKLFNKKLKLLISNYKFLKILESLEKEITNSLYNVKLTSKEMQIMNATNDKLIISIDNLNIKFAYYTNNNCKFGHLYKANNNTIIKYDHSIYERDYEEKTYSKYKNTEISILNAENIETFNYTLNDNQTYQIKNGEKVYTINPTIFTNLKQTIKKFRTKDNKIISWKNYQYYNMNMKKNDNTLYFINDGANYSNTDLSSIPDSIQVTKEELINYKNNNINYEELVKKYSMNNSKHL